MGRILTKTGIVNGQTILPGHVTQSIDVFTAQETYDLNHTGSYALTGSFLATTISGSHISSSGDLIGKDIIGETAVIDLIRSKDVFSIIDYSSPAPSTVSITPPGYIYIIDTSANPVTADISPSEELNKIIIIKDTGHGGAGGNYVTLSAGAGNIYTKSGNTGSIFVLPSSGSIQLACYLPDWWEI
jgi:hypothetical protein